MTYPNPPLPPIAATSTNGDTLRALVNKSLARALARECGYTLTDDQIAQVAASAGEMIAKGYPAAWAFAEALDDEIVLHGSN